MQAMQGASIISCDEEDEESESHTVKSGGRKSSAGFDDISSMEYFMEDRNAALNEYDDANF